MLIIKYIYTFSKIRTLRSVVLIVMWFSTVLTAQQQEHEIALSEIMKGEDFVGYLPEKIRWSEDGAMIYFNWNPDFAKLRSLFKVSRMGGKPVKVGAEEEKLLPGVGVRDKAGKREVYAKNGDIFLLYLQRKDTLQITNTVERESQPVFSGDEKYIIYRRGLNLYSWEMKTGTTKQLTNFIKGKESKNGQKPEYEQWVEADELALMQVLKERDDFEVLKKKRNESLKPVRPKKIYLQGKRLFSVKISPDMKVVTYRLAEYPKAKKTIVPKYVTTSGFVEAPASRSLVGAPGMKYTLGVYLTESDSSYILDTKQIPGIYDKPVYMKDYVVEGDTFRSEYEKARKVVPNGPWFSGDGKTLLEFKATDNKDRWIMLLEPGTGKLKLMDRQHDDAWIGGPGIYGWNMMPGNMGWLDDEHIWFQSEKTGYSHLYALNVRSGDRKMLTSGDFEILDVKLSRDKKTFYITSNKENPFEQHFYRMSSAGGQMEKITGQPGRYEVKLSPDEKYLAVRYSYSNRPWELFVMKNKPGAAMTRLTHSTTKAFDAISWYDPGIVFFKAGDGVEVPARLYRPEGAVKNGAAVLFVHGAGYLQNVHRWWSSYYREYMFHNLLLERGYTVLDVDYRGSSGYGRDWRTAIYRHMGGRDLDDFVDGASYLVKNHQIDPERIGIYGGSYGGFITLMAMFTRPGTFASGAALRSVTDWAHYNHGYTSNILNTPVEDSLAFRRSSPIYYAEGLEGKLLMLHGMVDDNVQFQDVVRLSQRLIELGKEDWELAVFPVERHGFKEASSWKQEYARILKLIETTLGK